MLLHYSNFNFICQAAILSFLLKMIKLKSESLSLRSLYFFAKTQKWRQLINNRERCFRKVGAIFTNEKRSRSPAAQWHYSFAVKSIDTLSIIKRTPSEKPYWNSACPENYTHMTKLKKKAGRADLQSCFFSFNVERRCK